MYRCGPCAHGSQNKTSSGSWMLITLELEFTDSYEPPCGLVGIELMFSATATSVLNHGALPPGPASYISQQLVFLTMAPSLQAPLLT